MEQAEQVSKVWSHIEKHEEKEIVMAEAATLK
jgi:hypothetical protein